MPGSDSDDAELVFLQLVVGLPAARSLKNPSRRSGSGPDRPVGAQLRSKPLGC